MRDKVIEALGEINSDADFENSEDFLEEGLLDSFEMVNLVGLLEDAFDIEISGRDIIAANFLNIDTICEMIAKYTEE